MLENKNGYFYIEIKLIKKENYSNKEGIDDDIDIILDKMGVNEESYKFRSKDNKRTVVYFKPDRRKRKGQLNKLCMRYLDKEVLRYTNTGGLTKKDYLLSVEKFIESKSSFEILEEPGKKLNEDYDRNNIEHFDERKN
jgi:hypothetical protein